VTRTREVVKLAVVAVSVIMTGVDNVTTIMLTQTCRWQVSILKSLDSNGIGAKLNRLWQDSRIICKTTEARTTKHESSLKLFAE
jgi:hypothetical protein